MKTCPQCKSTYPDTERFCATDGTALVGEGSEAAAYVPGASGRSAATVDRPLGGEVTECPICGGKAQPGEEICNFCGARLREPDALGAAAEPALAAQPSSEPAGAAQVYPEYAAEEERSAWRRIFGVVGYALAALVALAAGAWFALHLSSRPSPTTETAKEASPAVSPAPAAGPFVALAPGAPPQVTGESASAPERNSEAAAKVFEDNKSSLLGSYKRALAGNRTMSDGMLVTLRVEPGGEVTSGSVGVSTAQDPSLDADVIKTMMGWRFSPFGGSSVEVGYPIVFARDPAEQAAVRTALADKMAHLVSGASPEYAYGAAPTTGAVPGTSAGAIRPPEALATPAPSAPAVSPRKMRKRTEMAAIPPPTPSLLMRVNDRLRGDKRLGRVKAYTDPAGVVTLYGRVFDDADRRLAERTARGVDGVSKVVNTVTTDTSVWAEQEARINQNLQNAGLAKVTAKVIGSDAYLSGEVSDDSERERAVTIAETAAPVKVRTNLIRVAPKGLFGF